MPQLRFELSTPEYKYTALLLFQPASLYNDVLLSGDIINNVNKVAIPICYVTNNHTFLVDINNGIQYMWCDVYNHMLVFTLLFYPKLN